MLIFGGRFLDNSERLTEINGDRGPIEDKTTLHVMVRFKADGPGTQPHAGLLSMERWPESALTIVGARSGKGGADGSNRGCCIIS